MTRSTVATAVLVVAFMSVLSAAGGVIAADSQSPFWGNLIEGPYAVGFETVEIYDRTRVSREKLDYDGVPFDGERSRKIQICIWFPAAAGPDAYPMVYSEYVFPSPSDGSFYDYLIQLQGRELATLRGVYGNDMGRVRDVLNLPVKAWRGAERATGSFPLIIYHAHSATGISENFVLCEYLASHGFIVATSHSVGAGQLTPTLSQMDIETVIRDRELIFGHMLSYPNVDPDRIGLIGLSYGGLTALLMQMRNYDVDAVLSMNPLFARGGQRQTLTDNSGFDPSRAQVPIMLMYTDPQDTTVDLSVLDTLIYSRRYVAPLKGTTGRDVAVYGLMPGLLPDSTNAGADILASAYFDVCRLAREFLGVSVLGDKDGESSLETSVAALGGTVAEAQEAPPTETQFGRLIQQGRVAAAIDIFDQLRAADSTRTYFQEAAINMLGYQLLGQNRIDDARQILWLNTIAFPASANSWDSYADACVAAGDFNTVVTCYEKVLELLPGDTTLPENFREILLNNATQGLEQYKQ